MYGIDLRTAIFAERPMGLRRVYALVKHLPPGSATWVASLGQAAVWSTEDELLALIAELVHHQTRVLANVLGSKQQMEPLKVPRPEQPEVPGDDHRDVQRLASAEDIAGFFGLEEQE